MFSRRLFCGFLIFCMAASATGAMAQGATLQASPAVVVSLESIAVNWTAPSAPSAQDWVAMYRAGDPDTAYLAYQYTGGASSGRMSFTAPNQNFTSELEFRYFLNNGYVRSGVSNRITHAGNYYVTGPATAAGGDFVPISFKVVSNISTNGHEVGIAHVGSNF